LALRYALTHPALPKLLDQSGVDCEIRSLTGRPMTENGDGAFPSSPTSRNRRGIDRTDWIPIDRATYDACLDRRDYRRRDTSGS